MFICYRKLHQRIILKCVRYCTSRAAIRTFNDDSIQQPSTFLQQARSTSSVKGKSRSASKKRVTSDLDSMSIITTTQRKKFNIPRASNKENTCTLHIQYFCNKSNYKWYIKSQTDKCNNVKVGVHSGNLQIQTIHIPTKIAYLSDEVLTFINNCLKEQHSLSRISNLLFTDYKIVLPDSAISHFLLKKR